ncbi:MAG: hypothetical protein PHR45_05540 [Muribaculaceae bacterium]|nr:hypothetical protein [Muribaculaceae bacterium]
MDSVATLWLCMGYCFLAVGACVDGCGCLSFCVSVFLRRCVSMSGCVSGLS